MKQKGMDGMISSTVVKAFEEWIPTENIYMDEPMSRHTTFRIGGKADCLLQIESAEQLINVKKYLKTLEIPYFVLGNGSNLLVSDEGYRGVILTVAEKMSDVKVEGNRIIAQAGASMSKIARIAWENSLTGFEFASGIPGTIGGGVVMNAGAYDGELKQVVTLVKVVDEEGNLLELDNETMEFGYRTSAIKNTDFTAVEIHIQLKPGDKGAIKAKMDDLALRRREKQPLEYPSAGSTFKRPEGYFAGALIMNAGLRGYTVGDAQISEKHCGFVVNKGNATATDVMSVIQYVQEKVKEQFGVDLEPEVIVLK